MDGWIRRVTQCHAQRETRLKNYPRNNNLGLVIIAKNNLITSKYKMVIKERQCLKKYLQGMC